MRGEGESHERLPALTVSRVSDDQPRDNHPGRNTADLYSHARVLHSLDLRPGMRVLDLGCGRGGWSLSIARVVGSTGRVYAFDRRTDGLARLRQMAIYEGLDQISVWAGDAAEPIPLPDASMDCCLVAMVLHHLLQADNAAPALADIYRVLRPQGRLLVMEFRSVEPPPGPPKKIRVGCRDLRALLTDHGFTSSHVIALEPHVYLLSSNRSGGHLDTGEQPR